MDQYNVIWDSPSKDFNGSMPLGNGDIGLNLWVEAGGDLIFYISKTDAWDELMRLVKVGRVRVKLSPNPFVKGRPFLQTLHLRQGEIEICAGEKATQVVLRIWVDANQPVIRIEVKSKKKFSLEVTSEIWRTETRQLPPDELWGAYIYGNMYGYGDPPPATILPDTVVPVQQDRIIWFHRNTQSLWPETLQLQGLAKLIKTGVDPLLNRTFGALIEGEGLASKDDTTLISAKPQTKYLVSIYVHTNQTDTPEAWVKQITRLTARIRRKALEKLHTAHLAWWEKFWQRSWIHVQTVGKKNSQQSEVVSLGYALQRFITACAGHGAYPIKFNGSIFKTGSEGKWADYRAWGGPYWLQNSRLMYWPMLASGDFEMMRPYFDMFEKALPLAEKRTQIYFGHRGAFFPETMTFWGTYNNSDYSWNRTDRPVWYVPAPALTYHYTGALELLALMLDYYRHTQDNAFLVQELLPMADAVLRFFDEHFPRDAQGYLHMEPSQALEAYHDTINPATDVAGLLWVLDGLLALPPEQLGRARRTRWTRLRKALPALPTGESTDGNTVLRPAANVAQNPALESPELYPVFPFRLIGEGKPDVEAGRNTYFTRPAEAQFGWHQEAIFAAYLGLTDEARRHIVYRFGTKNPESRFPAFWGPNYDELPDQDHGGVGLIALQAMLLQAEDNKILLFPAWPKDWDVDFKLHAPKRTTVEGVYRVGKLEKLVVTPKSRRKDVVVMEPH
jgi:alpha-L-fucosidase 2